MENKNKYLKIIQEKSDVIGGLFAVITILAVIIEMALNGFELSAIAGGIKDIAGTMVTVLLMLAAIFAIMPEKLTFEQRLNNALNEWLNNNRNMLVNNDDMDKKKTSEDKEAEYFGIGMRTDTNNFFSALPKTKKTGLFVRIPSIKSKNYKSGNIVLEFSLNISTFFGSYENVPENGFTIVKSVLEQYIDKSQKGFAEVSKLKDPTKIKVVIKEPIKSDKDIKKLINLLNEMYSAYLVISYYKVPKSKVE